MPYKPMQICRHPGCAARTSGRYCDKHRRQEYRATSTQRGYGSRWRKERKAFLNAHPICAHCGHPAEVVDHITPHRGIYDLMWDHDNWQPLCKKCHDFKTGTFDTPHEGRGGSDFCGDIP